MMTAKWWAWCRRWWKSAMTTDEVVKRHRYRLPDVALLRMIAP